MPQKTKSAKRRVKFAVQADRGNEVAVAGTFNDWDPARNKMRFKDGTWAASLLLLPGRYEYKFVINGVWCVDPACNEWTPNAYGSLNSVVTVA